MAAVQSTLKYHRFNYTAQCTCSSINNTNITPTFLPNTHPAPPPSKSTICVYTAQHFSTLRQHCLRFMSAQKPTLFSESKRVLTISSTSAGTRHTTGDVILHDVKKLQFLRGSGKLQYLDSRPYKTGTALRPNEVDEAVGL